MYTLVNIEDNSVKVTGLSQTDFENGSYTDAGKGLYKHYITSDLTGTPKVHTTRVVNHTTVEHFTFDEVREIRTKMLRDSDYRDLPSYPGTDQEAWRTYRQKLRDIPQDYNKVMDVVFPTRP